MSVSQYTALAAATDPSTGVVVATGLVIVFSVLILLFLIISLEGVIFSSLDKNKKGKPEKTAAKDTKPQPKPAANIAPASVEKGIPAEVVAAISAAIACMQGGGNYVIRSLKRAKKGSSAWSNAAAASYTEPF